MPESQCYKPRKASRSTHVDVRGIHYHVREWGDPEAAPLFMLHGWGDSGGSFQFLVDALDRDLHVIAPDWRGFGETRCRANNYWFPDYLADLDVLLTLFSADQPADLLGHSMGGNVAALYAGAFPERVRRLINVEGFGLPDSDPDETPGHYRRWIERSREPEAYRDYASYDELAARIAGQNPHMSDDKASYVARLWAEQDDGRVRLRADPAHKLPNGVRYRRAEAIACWVRIEAPVLLVSGEQSRFRHGADEWLGAVTAARPQASVAVSCIAAAGHMIHFEQPGPLAAEVEMFLAASGAAP